MSRQMNFLRLVLGGFSTCAFLVCILPVQASPVLINGSFESTIGRPTNDAGGMLANSANIRPLPIPDTVTGWTIARDGIACVAFPNTYANGVCGPDRFQGSGFQPIAGPNHGPGLSPDGGNFILIDGDRSVPVSATLYQKVDQLIVGHYYDVSFFQAAAQFLDRTGSTTEQWDVSLGGSVSALTTDGNFATGVHMLSDLMVTASASFHGWEEKTVRLQVIDPQLANGSVTSQLLGFFSVGAPGGQPPIVLLDGVRITAVPEPHSLGLVGLGLLGVLLTQMQQKKRV